MMNCHANKAIRCSVNQCANHCSESEFCSLDTIRVGTHEMNPTEIKCTDCESFKLGLAEKQKITKRKSLVFFCRE